MGLVAIELGCLLTPRVREELGAKEQVMSHHRCRMRSNRGDADAGLIIGIVVICGGVFLLSSLLGWIKDVRDARYGSVAANHRTVEGPLTEKQFRRKYGL